MVFSVAQKLPAKTLFPYNRNVCFLNPFFVFFFTSFLPFTFFMYYPFQSSAVWLRMLVLDGEVFITTLHISHREP